jgi:predicted RNA methylase
MTEATALAHLENIGDLTAGRDKAIALWLETYDMLHANTEAAGRASIGGSIGLSANGGHGRDEFTARFLAGGEVTEWDREGRKQVTRPAREVFAESVTAAVDRRCWDHLMKHLGFDQLLDRQAREEFHAGLRETPPPFTPENCAATFGNIWSNRREMYLRGIANVFMAMDRRFRSHDAFAIGNRLIIDGALSEYGGWNCYDRRDTLRDVERIFRELDEQPPLSEGQSIASQIASRSRGRTIGDYFKVDTFKNGNVHLWFTRKDLLAKVNELLLEYYNPVEGDRGEGPSYEAGPLYHTAPAKYFGAFNSSEDVAQRVIGLAEIREGMTVLEPSAGTGMLAKAARAKGGQVMCIELQPGLAHELRAVHRFPKVEERDFLQCDPAHFASFDRIVMNPPFDRGRDCDHVRHAYQFLRPGGILVAVMSARAEFATDARHKALHDLIAQSDTYHGRWNWRDLPERSFAHAGTNVNTVMLIMQKPRV